MSTTPVVHLELLISPRIIEKHRNDSFVQIRGMGKDDSWQKYEAKKPRDCRFKKAPPPSRPARKYKEYDTCYLAGGSVTFLYEMKSLVMCGTFCPFVCILCSHVVNLSNKI